MVDRLMLAKQAYDGYRGVIPMLTPKWDDMKQSSQSAWVAAISYLIIDGSDGNEYLIHDGNMGFLLTEPVEIPG